MSRVTYVSVVGCLTCAMVCTRLDIAQIVNIVSRYMSKSDLEGLEIIELYVHSQMIERVYT